MKINLICLLKTVRYKTHSFKCLLTKLAYVPSFLVDFVQVLVVNAIVRYRRVTTIRLLSHFMWSDFPPVTSAQRARVFICGWRKGQHKLHVMGFHFGSRTAAHYCNHASTEMHLQSRLLIFHYLQQRSRLTSEGLHFFIWGGAVRILYV